MLVDQQPCLHRQTIPPPVVEPTYIPKRMAAHRLTISSRSAAPPLLIGLAIIVAHLPSFVHRLMDGDEAVYGSIAVLMNMGGGLYDAGGVDNKPPGIYWIYSLTFRIFGSYQMTAVHAVTLIVIA